ncbi:gluconate 2-dehydrogenase subunit 3 family protein [Paenibacillus thailandensis]|uniref:Gluconate 2-dehydrogenase subunit 3 family protein n=1 Tax=Paenibacillus thailandensis TaxID=393250 RepID=A0ABW5QXP7_9BACL
MADNNEARKNEPQDASRRNFLKYTGTALGGVVVGGVIGGLIGANTNRETEQPPNQSNEAAPGESNNKDYNQALMFLTQSQFQTTQAAAERIFPEDESGPGAKTLGVAYFIDHQLAGSWGINARDYMMGPFYEAEAEQGYQLSFKRHELFTLGLKGLEDYSKNKFNNPFTALKAEQQDEVLTAFAENKADIKGLPAATFFNLLRQLTIEGVYADPLYGGNKNMDGWRMRSYPGNQYSYYNDIEKDEFLKIEPLSLHDHLNLG